MQGRLPLCQDLTASLLSSPSFPPSLQPLVLGSRFPPLTGKTYLEGGLKGLQTVSDRGCLAADVAGLMCHSTEGPESWGEVRGCVWGGGVDISRNSRLALTGQVQVPSAFAKGHLELTGDERIAVVRLLWWWRIRVMQSAENGRQHFNPKVAKNVITHAYKINK